MCPAIPTQAANNSPVDALSPSCPCESCNSFCKYSDIKPDNVLLDIMGHAHITDFNVAIHYSSSRLHTSVAGSLAYMAPEVCGRKGYSWQADWWSLGVCAYELMLGRRPFEGRTGESLTASILKEPLRFPERASQLVSEDGINALKQVRSLISFVLNCARVHI